MKFVSGVPRRSAPVFGRQCLAEAIESRLLLSATVTDPINNLTVPADTSGDVIPLTSHFDDPQVTGPVVQIQTNLGAVTAILDDQGAPTTVNNFLEYALGGSYNGTIFHKSLKAAGQVLVAAGEFDSTGSHIPTLPPIPNEASLSNVRGTIAADLENPADPNSATSGFLFNLGNNSAALDPLHYTVFGDVVSGLNVLTSINTLPTVDGTSLNPSFTSLPVQSATGGLGANNLVTISSVQEVSNLTFTATSDNPSLVQPAVVGSNLQLLYTPGKSGYARVNVVATDVTGTQVSQTFRVKVLADASRSADVPLGSGRSLTFVDANRSAGTISISGPGTAVVHMAGDALQVKGGRVRGSNQQVQGITVTGTTPATTITILGRPKRGKTLTIGDITADGPLAMVRVKRANVEGDVTAGGTVRRIEMDGASNGTITVGAGARPMQLFVGGFSDENLTSGTPISLIRAFQWAGSDNVDETLSTPFISRLIAFGSFVPGLQLSGAPAGHMTLGPNSVGGFIGGKWNVAGRSAPLRVGGTNTSWDATFDSLPNMVVNTLQGVLTVPSIRSILVRGNVLSAFLNFTGPFASGALDLGQLTVRGGVFNSAIQSAGNIGSISAKDMRTTLVTAGVGPLSGTDPLPASPSDFASPAQIRSISLHPSGRNVVGFLNSDVAASNIGSLTMGTTRVANGQPFGVAAHSIGRLTGRDLSHKQNLVFVNLTDAAALAQQVAARNLNLQDFVIRIL